MREYPGILNSALVAIAHDANGVLLDYTKPRYQIDIGKGRVIHCGQCSAAQS